MTTGCVCQAPGYCERHRVVKNKHWFHLCQTRPKYWEAWEAGRGPGQGRPRTEQPPRATIPRGRWITTQQLATDTLEVCQQLPSDIGRIVAIPRSGLIPATIAATHLHLPLFTIVDDQIVPAGGGGRVAWGVWQGDGGRTLFMDDTIGVGGTVRRLAERGVITSSDLIAVVYAFAMRRVHYFAAHLPFPHLLEWNLLNCPWATRLAVDLDGIVCLNPPRDHIPHMAPRRAPVKAIITARPERERDATVAWLAAHRVQYAALIMWDGTEEDRWNIAAVAAWKAAQVRQCNPDFYIESEPEIADAMRAHGVQVLCPRQGYLA